MRRPLAASLGLGAALLVAGVRSTGGAPAERLWTFGSISPEGSWYWDLSEDIARSMERAVPGLRIKRRFGGVLGDEVTTIGMVRSNRLDLWAGSLGAVADIEPRFGLLELPFSFPDVAALQAGLTRLDRGQKGGLPEAAAKRGLAMLHMGLAGWRNFASLDRPIRTAADLRGVRARSQPGRVHRAMWQALGALPVETPLNGLVESLREEKLTALDVPITFLFATSTHEAVKHFTVTRHVPQFAVLVASRQTWATLPPALRDKARAAALGAANRAEPHIDELEEELIGQLGKRGTAIIRLTAAERATFMDATKGLVSKVGAGAADRPLLQLMGK